MTESKPATFTFQHPQLGKLTGVITPENVVQFRAIQYASIPSRFKQSILNEGPLEGDGDYTQYGFSCPQVPSDHIVGGGPLPNQIHPHPSNEFKCLILQVNVPLACLLSPPTLSALPILIYIHGGGFILGKIDEAHNTSLLVEESLLDKQPIVSVSIQYRLGALGYLHAPDGHGNFALGDQRNALRWVKRFIAGFGGDGGRITLMGESAGAMSICAQILAQNNGEGVLFNRVVLMSGVLGPATAPASIEEASETYKRFVKELGIEEEGDEALKKLREIDVETIVETSRRMGEDGALWRTQRSVEFFGEKAGDLTWDRVPEYIGRVEGLEELILGSTSFEGTMFMDRISNITPKDFLDGVSKHSGPETAERIAQIYEISPSMDQNLFITRMMRWGGDIVFDVPNHSLARYLTTHTNKKVYTYIFDVRNPFPNSPFYQQAHHWVDKYFVFKVHQFRYPSQRLKDISTRHAQLWIEFTNGKVPWAEYKYTGKGNEVVMVADEREGWIERSAAEYERIMELSWKRIEDVAETWEKEKGRTFNPMLIGPMKGKKLT